MLTAALVLGGVGFTAAVGLVVASRFLAVEVDPRIDEIDDVLPGANCGGCGYPGCRGYAEAVVKGKADMTLCAPGGAEAVDAIAAIMGVEVEKVEPRVAVVLCSGDQHRGKEKFIYDGIADCRAAHNIGGGHKVCPTGCLGLGTCRDVCPFDAVIITDNRLAVVDAEKCTGCGNCVDACPRGIIQLFPRSHQVHVLCVNSEKGARVRKYCSCGCIACKLCAKETKHISMDGYLAKVTQDPIPAEDPIPEEAVLVCAPGTILDTRRTSALEWATDEKVREERDRRAKELKKRRKAEKEAKKKAREAKKKAQQAEKAGEDERGGAAPAAKGES
jgi:electron transport complex protein RnfB